MKFAGFTVSRSVVVSVSEPDVPVIVMTTEDASEEVLLAVIVRMPVSYTHLDVYKRQARFTVSVTVAVAVV